MVMQSTKGSGKLKRAVLNSSAASAAIVAALGGGVASAQDNNSALQLDVVTVTARKTEESAQTVPISLQAIGEAQLDEQNVGDFEDFVVLAPALSFISLGPGQARPYMRGIAADNPELGMNNGTQPSVAIYMDEQPVTSIGRNIDLYVTDVAAVEVLAGPQGTLYGASSQSGTIKYVTNKPNASNFEASAELDYSYTGEGDPSTALEGMVNIPLVEDKIALRLVGWNVDEGGYIDNIATEQTNPDGQGFTYDNNEFAGDDFNDASNQGIRAQIGIDLNDSWTLRGSYLTQDLERSGVFGYDPEVGDLAVNRFQNDALNDEVDQLGVTLEGSVGDFDLVYSGTFLEREVDYEVDYTAYALQSPYVEYYACYYDANYVFYDCGDQRTQFTEDTSYVRQNHEARIQSPQDRRLRFIAGAFYESNKFHYDTQWASVDTKPGLNSRDGTWFLTEAIRKDTQFALFGEATFDITDTLSATYGTRYYDAESSMLGYVDSLFTGYMPIDFTYSEDGFIHKLNLSYTPNDDTLLYATYSEGFRMGGLNRFSAPGAVPANYQSDFLQNYEFGWKTEWLDGRLRFNGNAYYMEWTDVQLSTIDFDISFLTFTTNLGAATSMGVEGELTALLSEGLTWNGSFSLNKSELEDDYIRAGALVAPAGTDMAFTPDVKLASTLRYERTLSNDFDGYAQLQATYVGESYNDIQVDRRQLQEAYTLTNVSAGVTGDNWNAELYVRNLTDERPELFRSAVDADGLITTSRPRTIGVRVGYTY